MSLSACTPGVMISISLMYISVVCASRLAALVLVAARTVFGLGRLSLVSIFSHSASDVYRTFDPPAVPWLSDGFDALLESRSDHHRRRGSVVPAEPPYRVWDNNRCDVSGDQGHILAQVHPYLRNG